MATASGVSTPLQLPSTRRVGGCCSRPGSPAPGKNAFPRRAAGGAPAGQSCHQFLPLKQSGRLQAAVLPVTPPLLDDEEKRKQMCEDYGFKQIGEQLPDNVTLKDVMDSLPKEVFEIDDLKSWTSVLISVTSYALGIFLISKAPWYLLPLAWAWTGTAVTGFFVIGHDCAHKSFSRNKLVEDIVGTLAFLPLIYPYEPWRFKHDRHHAKTNIPNELPRVKISLASVLAFMAIGWPLIILKSGIAGWFKFWFMPWMMSTFTMVHHTAPHIPFKTSEEWNAAQAQLNGTVHCDYPRWIEILCHDINVHVPHHISPRIPSYNLRAAYDSIKQNWGKYINEASWNWRLMKTILTKCHVYDKDRYYVPFDEVAPEESQPIKFLKKVMPDYA
uniref:Fatty acid desaturase domain-containing protein n=2 Tax=Oryza TaxID=4527 RepID=A0A0D3H0Q6_9ORYZ